MKAMHYIAYIVQNFVCAATAYKDLSINPKVMYVGMGKDRPDTQLKPGCSEGQQRQQQTYGYFIAVAVIERLSVIAA
jgi:hypothetical protein